MHVHEEGSLDGWLDGWMHDLMDGWMYDLMDGWAVDWLMDGITSDESFG